MAQISGVYSNPLAGRLRVTLTGSYSYAGGGIDPGSSIHPKQSKVGEIYLQGYVNGELMLPINSTVLISVLELDYPGNNAQWPVSTSTVYYSAPTKITVTMGSLNMTCQLLKK